MALLTQDIEELLTTAERVRVLAHEFEAAEAAYFDAVAKLTAAERHRDGVLEQLCDARRGLQQVAEGPE